MTAHHVSILIVQSLAIERKIDVNIWTLRICLKYGIAYDLFRNDLVTLLKVLQKQLGQIFHQVTVVLVFLHQVTLQKLVYCRGLIVDSHKHKLFARVGQLLLLLQQFGHSVYHKFIFFLNAAWSTRRSCSLIYRRVKLASNSISRFKYY